MTAVNCANIFLRIITVFVSDKVPTHFESPAKPDFSGKPYYSYCVILQIMKQFKDAYMTLQQKSLMMFSLYFLLSSLNTQKKIFLETTVSCSFLYFPFTIFSSFLNMSVISSSLLLLFLKTYLQFPHFAPAQNSCSLGLFVAVVLRHNPFFSWVPYFPLPFLTIFIYWHFS